ncbi:FecR domain-containing protein [Nitrosopumilus piranensis]|uniref:FecR domain-containing protein n=1 Tax=Nitrosopumilus piranensis TaxID=1582439 RepID=UPI000A881073|nr:FecR domain-containing protein [Nitrosopumilus piranensis]
MKNKKVHGIIFILILVFSGFSLSDLAYGAKDLGHVDIRMSNVMMGQVIADDLSMFSITTNVMSIVNVLVKLDDGNLYVVAKDDDYRLTDNLVGSDRAFKAQIRNIVNDLSESKQTIQPDFGKGQVYLFYVGNCFKQIPITEPKLPESLIQDVVDGKYGDSVALGFTLDKKAFLVTNESGCNPDDVSIDDSIRMNIHTDIEHGFTIMHPTSFRESNYDDPSDKWEFVFGVESKNYGDEYANDPVLYFDISITDEYDDVNTFEEMKKEISDWCIETYDNEYYACHTEILKTYTSNINGNLVYVVESFTNYTPLDSETTLAFSDYCIAHNIVNNNRLWGLIGCVEMLDTQIAKYSSPKDAFDSSGLLLIKESLESFKLNLIQCPQDIIDPPNSKFFEYVDPVTVDEARAIAQCIENTVSDWHTTLPHCPCLEKDIKTDKRFIQSNLGLKKHHPNAENGYRTSVWWHTQNNAIHGQQCTYDKAGVLITYTSSAGTPDWWAPKSDLIIDTRLPDYMHHDIIDVQTSNLLSWEEYSKTWKPNDGINCSANSGNSVGYVEKLTGHVQIKKPTETDFKVLSKDHVINKGDTIITNENSNAVIHFADDTNLTIGENSEVTIDSFVYRDDYTVKEKTIQVIKGIFRWVSGTLTPHTDSKVLTPVEAMTIRGTDFVLEHNSKTNSDTIFLNEGKIDVIPISTNTLMQLEEGNKIIVNKEDGLISKERIDTEEWDSLIITLDSNNPQIPNWIKNNAEWWAEGSIDDSSFVSGIQYMIKEDMIYIPDLSKQTKRTVEGIPDWIRNNAGWWADGTIDDRDFLNGIQYLVSNGIVVIGDEDAIKVKEIDEEYSDLDEDYVYPIGENEDDDNDDYLENTNSELIDNNKKPEEQSVSDFSTSRGTLNISEQVIKLPNDPEYHELMVNGNFGSSDFAEVNLVIYYEQDQTLFSIPTATFDDGYFEIRLAVDPQWEIGSYTIIAEHSDTEFARATFQVME